VVRRELPGAYQGWWPAGNMEGTLFAEVAVGNLRLVPCWGQWEGLMASWEGEIREEPSRRKRFSLKEGGNI